MERSRSKRNHYYDQDYESQTLPRTKQRYHHHNSHYNNSNSGGHHRRGGVGGRLSKAPEGSSSTAATSYRILCDDNRVGGVIGKSGSIIKAIRQETGAWINVHALLPGDDERIIEISDNRRRDPDGRFLSFSPAQEALLMIHERIMESDSEFGFRYNGSAADDDEDYGPRGSGNRVATRLVVARMHVGCLLGKGGKIIEQMRIETKTQIRILPRDHNLPRCVSMSDEIVQVVGDVNAVKKAIAIISSRLKESQLRDRSHFHGRVHSPERFFLSDDDFGPHINNMPHQSPIDGATLGPRSSAGMPTLRNNSYGSRTSSYAFESGAGPIADHQSQPFSAEDLVFRILCPNDKVDSVMGEASGIIEMIQDDIGIDIRVDDTIPGSDEQIIIITSEEGPDDELFPAQEALLHIQSQIVDLGPDKDNIVTTRLLVPSSEIGCLEGRDGLLSEMRRLTGANIHILPREELPVCVPGADELIQIVGEIKAARDALVEVTSRLRSYMYREISFSKDLLPPSISATAPAGSVFGFEAASPVRIPSRESFQGSDTSPTYQNVQTVTTARPSKEAGVSCSGSVDRNEGDSREDVPSAPSRIAVPLVTRSTLEVVIPEHAIPKLIMRSGNKLAQISELSKASVSLVEDRPELTEKAIQISGTPEQVERAQSLLQGFILSTQEDDPSS
ncbi:RNA-binding KH domain-containing protein RCF3-like isoform X2 [Macadamia integrifolia]|uniref:RNA-binding KH domain-containing protein RCF3-like isoform X2 n=1 Tax=Macadamia integrifolia TaxID=60698 RepID=UPI001C533DB2|nr:RNA-binding KH domain-containing protein RCF3-like isoform X2 [Macadamia integrifolia]